MESFKDFYNGLDILNLILFWGIIVVTILIIIFLTLYFSRRKNITLNVENEDDFDDVNVIKLDNSNVNDQKLSVDSSVIENEDSNLNVKNINEDVLNKVNEEIYLDNDTIKIPDQKMEVRSEINSNIQDYSKNNDIVIEKKNNIESNLEDNNVNIVIEKNNTIEVKKASDEFLFDELVKKDTNSEKPRAYQKNVFREMNSRNQTSPIGIVRERKTNSIDEYKESLTETKDSYLENVYNSLSEATVPDKVELTEYEKRQEEDAVISYQELLRKKDTIDYDREEDAVISYGELVSRNSRLYNIREEEEDKEFLSELKKFRKDL